MADISIQSDLREPLALLNSMGGKKPKMMKSLLGQVGTYAKNAAKREYPKVLNKRTGKLYKSIRREVRRNGQEVVVTAHDRSDKVRYGFMLAHGATILPKKKGGTLYIKDASGRILARAKSVTYGVHDFIEGPVKNYLKTGRFKSELDKATQKQIDKLEKAAKKR